MPQNSNDNNLNQSSRYSHIDKDKLFSFAIMRSDLEMDPGKLSSQAAHVSAACLIEFLSKQPEYIEEFRATGKSGSRIVLLAKTEHKVLRAYNEAKELGLPCALFSDSDHILPPHFTGDPVITGVGIGPCLREQAKPITKRFRCA